MIHVKKRILLASVLMPFILSACINENGLSEVMLSSDSNLASSEPLSIQKTLLVANNTFANYSGNKEPAVLNKVNTLKFVDLLYPTVAFASKPYTQTTARNSGALSGLLKHQKAILRATLAQANSNTKSQRDSGIYDFKHCLFKGTTQHQTDTSYKFTNCQQFENLSIDGEITLIGTEASFTDLAVNDDGHTYRYSGTISTYSSDNRQVIEASMQRIDSVNNQQQYFKDLVWAEGKTDLLEGRIYDGENGFIELSASDDLVLDNNGIPTLGKLHLHGKAYGKSFLSKPKDNDFGSIHLEIDEEGDGFNEFRIGKNVIYKTTSKAYAAR